MPVSVSIAGPDDAEELAAALVGLVPQLSRSNPPPSLGAVRAKLAVVPIPTGIRAWVEDVIVDESVNGQGIGRLLIDAMLNHARSQGCATVDLTSRPSREAAHHLYNKAGFIERGTTVYRIAVCLSA